MVNSEELIVTTNMGIVRRPHRKEIWASLSDSAKSETVLE